ncbi:hypothetical protein POSPLADRAFT_1143479 [Postia placenta MAD-698-R-SB12]|uniref:F-box domain-containing protein n=1 Tax=Postia placenta MAD-698-R-SB12 TaxID=670580 RepID=A0A1X6N1D1_9APHY|nr:hypothetical protein POSPLADRAFT_1143479 [Postia placenta MAD-698-R-SB12]OSX62404.1 hypothetical protein POSPLADRAFT_1143479 [Postia placenta MAD-698-R-SB12]
MQIRQRPELPVELWMHILDDVVNERNHDAIARCAMVCRFFQHMCKKHLKGQLTFGSEECWNLRLWRAHATVFGIVCSTSQTLREPSCMFLTRLTELRQTRYIFVDRSRFGSRTNFNKEDVERLKTDTTAKEIGGWRGPQRVCIRGENDSKAIPHVATLAFRFAGRWTRIEKLNIRKALWPLSLRAANAAVFRDLSCFASITRLGLYDVTFPSIIAFGALVSALSGLEKLHLRDVKLTGSSALFDPRTLSDFRLLPPTKNLRHITLGHAAYDGLHEFFPSAWPCYTELLAFMTAVSNPCGKSPRVYPWGSVRNLRLDENVWWKFSSCSIARLLRALPSLENLEFATADSHLANVEITGVPTHPRPKPITIGVHCASAQPRNVAHIIRCLIHMDFPLTIMRIYATVYPFLQDAHRLVATAISELVQHAGPSLDDLGVFLQGDRYDSVIPIDAAADRYRQCDLFATTKPMSLRVYGCEASCLGVREILSHVTSRCVSSISIRFKPLEPSDRGELSEGLSQLDTVLLLPVFDNLVHVLISLKFRWSRPRLEMKECAHFMKSWLLRLHERGVLGIEICDENWR